MIVDPMLISKQPPKDAILEAINSNNYLAQVKKDGAWYQLKVERDNIYLYSRAKSKVTGEYSEKSDRVPHIIEWARKNIPAGTTLIGEIYYPGKHSNDVTKIMGCLPQTAIARQEKDEYGGPIHYYIHDIIEFAGKPLLDVGFEERYDYLTFLRDEVELPDYIEFAKAWDTNLQEILSTTLENGEEGMVFKSKDGVYKPGKRPLYNFKVKTKTTFDAFVQNFVFPEKEYTGKDIENWPYIIDGEPVTKAYYNGWFAGIVVAAYDDDGNPITIGKVTSGMTDFLRKDMAKRPDLYLLQVVEIEAMSVDKENKTLRHARLLEFREDKSDLDCKISDIF